MSTSATVSCEGGFCRIKPIPLGQIAGLDSASVVAVDSPIAGQAFPTPTDVVFEWHGPADAASIVVILDQMVAYDSEIQYHAIWGAVRGALRNGRLGSRTGT